MKRHLFQSISALFLLATLSLASCNKEDIPGEDPEVQQPVANEITFTATLAPKGEGPLSKAITPGTDANDKEILNVAWAEGEEIAVYYQKTDNSYATATATVGTPNVDGSAPLTATLADAKGGTAKFVYPATLANTTGDIDEAALLNQNGNLTGANGISTKFDAATGTGTIVVTGSEATVSGTVTMTNQVCICKFHFNVVESYGWTGPIRNFSTPVIIDDGDGRTYTITSDRTGDYIGGLTRGFNSSDDIYVAMLPVSDKTVTFSTTFGSNDYSYTVIGTTLTEGKFYRNLSINMVKGGYTHYYGYNQYITSTITIPAGGTLTLNKMYIEVSSGPAIQCEGDATIILTGANIVSTSASDYPAIQAGGSGTTLTIQGGGSLTATCGIWAAAIGSGRDSTCGDIIIIGGSVTATGGNSAAAIGAGLVGHCGNVTIGSGVIRVTANINAANPGPYSIGKGYSVGEHVSTCGTITIGNTVYYDGSAFQNGGETYLATSPLVYQP